MAKDFACDVASQALIELFDCNSRGPYKTPQCSLFHWLASMNGNGKSVRMIRFNHHVMAALYAVNMKSVFFERRNGFLP